MAALAVTWIVVVALTPALIMRKPRPRKAGLCYAVR